MLQLVLNINLPQLRITWENNHLSLNRLVCGHVYIRLLIDRGRHSPLRMTFPRQEGQNDLGQENAR